MPHSYSATSTHVRRGTEAEHIPRAEDGEPAVTTSHTRTQGAEGSIHADSFNVDGGLSPPIKFRKQFVIRYVILPSATPSGCRSATTNGSRSHGVDGDKPRSRNTELRCRRFPGGRTGRACQEKSTRCSAFGRSWHRDGYLTPCVLDQETSSIDLATRLCDVWEDRLAGMEEGSSSLRAVT